MDNKHLQDIRDIKQIMERSSRFLSLSGISGVMAGIYALIGAFYAYWLLYYPSAPYGTRFHYVNEPEAFTRLCLTASVVLIASVFTAAVQTSQKAKKRNEKLYTRSFRRILGYFVIPLIAGAAFLLIHLIKGNYHMIASGTLLFYGLALVAVSPFTYGDIKFLGICQIILAIISSAIPGYGLICWSLGFGILHIVYGISMYLKYDRSHG